MNSSLLPPDTKDILTSRVVNVICKLRKSNVIATMLAAVLLTFAFRVQAGRTYSNPVYEEMFTVSFADRSMTLGIGDPTVISYQGKYYMYGTGDNRSYHAYLSRDLVQWEKGPPVFEISENGLWAPDVFHDPDDNRFYLFYTVSRRIGVAVADKPDMVFKDRGPLIADAIDAHMFRDEDGSYYLYYTTYPSLNIYVQEMENPLRKKDTPPVRLLAPTVSWERKHILVTEAPWMIKHNGLYYLIYSGGGSDSADYATGFAFSENPTGPFTRYISNPIIKKGNGVFGPGHGSIVADGEGKLWLFYHQKYNGNRNWKRFIAMDRIWFDEKGILNCTPTRNRELPAPVTTIEAEKTTK